MTTSNYDERVLVKFLCMHYSAMVGENFEFLMSYMWKKCCELSKIRLPSRQKSENSNSSPKPFLPLKSDFHLQTEPFGKSWFLRRIMGRNDTTVLSSFNCINFYPLFTKCCVCISMEASGVSPLSLFTYHGVARAM